MDGEIDKAEYQEKKKDLELGESKVVKRLEQLNSLIERGEDDLEEALNVANQLPELWETADFEERRGILQAVVVRFVIDQKRVADVELRPPYSWLARWAVHSGRRIRSRDPVSVEG